MTEASEPLAHHRSLPSWASLSVRFMLAAIMAASTATYILTWRPTPSDSLPYSLALVAIFLLLVLAVILFSLAAIQAALEDIRSLPYMIPAGFLGYILYDGLATLGRLDRISYLTTFIPVVAAALVAWFVAAFKIQSAPEGEDLAPAR